MPQRVSTSPGAVGPDDRHHAPCTAGTVDDEKTERESPRRPASPDLDEFLPFSIEFAPSGRCAAPPRFAKSGQFWK